MVAIVAAILTTAIGPLVIGPVVPAGVDAFPHFPDICAPYRSSVCSAYPSRSESAAPPKTYLAPVAKNPRLIDHPRIDVHGTMNYRSLARTRTLHSFLPPRFSAPLFSHLLKSAPTRSIDDVIDRSPRNPRGSLRL